MTDENENLRPPTDGGVDPASGTGAFRTPKGIIDFLTANPPLGEVKDEPTPLDPSAPEIVRGNEWWRKLDDMEACGIKRNGNVIIAWAIHELCAVVVRAVRRYDGGEPATRWDVVASVDCEKAVEATVYGGGLKRANNVVKEMRNALVAARLRRSHYRMNRNARRANAEETHVAKKEHDDGGTTCQE